MVEENGKRLRPFILSQSSGLPFITNALCACAGTFPTKAKGELDSMQNHFAKCRFPGKILHNAEISIVGVEIRLYETITGTKINFDKSSGLHISAWRDVHLQGSFSWNDRPCKIPWHLV